MFDIISRLRPITLDCFTAHSGLYHQFPVVKATEIYPSWWKSLKSTAEMPTENNPIKTPMSTLKVCEGLLDMYKNMVTIPMWTDLKIQYDEKGGFAWKSSVDDLNIGHHPTAQFNHPDFDDLIHMKITVPWMIQEKTGVNFQLFHSDWNSPANMFKFRIPGGILNYKYQIGANCNMWLPKIIGPSNVQIDLYAGDPLMNLLPLSERKVNIKNHLLDPIEAKQKEHQFGYSSKFVGRYKFLKKLYSK
jgi:hypothetical protein